MAIKYGFYNSISGDRKYNAEDFGKIFDGVIRDGVFESIYDKFQITILSDLSVSVGKGKAWFNKTFLENDANYPVSFTEAEVLLNRIDAVVLEFDSTEGVRANSIKVITGTPGSTPQKPTLTRTDTINQYPLCYATIPAKATSITTANLDVRIGATDCPYVVLQSGQIPGLANLDELIQDAENLSTRIDETVEELAFIKKDGDGTKVLTNDGTYKPISPVLLATLTTSGTFNPANYPEYLRFIFVMYGGGGGGARTYRASTGTDIQDVILGGGGGAGGKTVTPKIALTGPVSYTIGSGGDGGGKGSNTNENGINGGSTQLLTHTAGGGEGGKYGDISDGYFVNGGGGAGGTGTEPGTNGKDGGSGGAGADSQIGTGGTNGGNATGYAAGGAGGYDDGQIGDKNGGNGSPGMMYVYGLLFNTEV